MVLRQNGQELLWESLLVNNWCVYLTVWPQDAKAQAAKQFWLMALQEEVMLPLREAVPNRGLGSAPGMSCAFKSISEALPGGSQSNECPFSWEA